MKKTARDKEKSKKQFRIKLDPKTLIDIFSDYEIRIMESPTAPYGEVDHDEKKIYLNNKQSPAEKKRTLLHELVHIECDRMNINAGEKSVDAAANELYNQLYQEPASAKNDCRYR